MLARNPVYSPGLMPVVTPLDPSVNSSHQLSLSAAAVTQSEIWRATRLAPVRTHPRLLNDSCVWIELASLRG